MKKNQIYLTLYYSGEIYMIFFMLWSNDQWTIVGTFSSTLYTETFPTLTTENCSPQWPQHWVHRSSLAVPFSLPAGQINIIFDVFFSRQKSISVMITFTHHPAWMPSPPPYKQVKYGKRFPQRKKTCFAFFFFLVLKS